MRLHNRGRAIAFRLFFIFSVTFGGAFLLLNIKFVEKNVQYDANRTFVYEMTRSIIFNPFEKDERLDALANAPGSTLLLISCYPVGTDYKRIAIQASLVLL